MTSGLKQVEAAKRLTPLAVITLILSVYVLLALLVESLFQLPPGAHVLLNRIDFFVCLVFLADFFTRLVQAPSKLAFLKWGWIDFVSSIPTLDVFRVGRAVRIVRVFRILRAFRSAKNLVTYLVRHRKITALAAVGTSSFVVVVFSAIAMLQFETGTDVNIKTAGDAFWWAFVTVTTVGYGDKYPLTVGGRVLACFLMTAGVGLFGTFTGFVASLFVEPDCEKEESEHQQVVQELKALRTKIESIESKLSG